MKSLMQFLLLFAGILLASTNGLTAQDSEQEATAYHIHTYFQVPSGGHEDYLAMEKAWKKIHQHNIKAGKYQYWELTEILMPSGSESGSNYVTRLMVKGEKNMAAAMTHQTMPDNLSDILTPAEMALVNKTGEIRTHVKTEVYVVSDLILDKPDEAGVEVMNHFSYPEGSNHAQHVKMEQDIWKPVHDARIKAGEMTGWVIARKAMPVGAGQRFKDVTVDLYKDLETFLSSGSPIPHFEKVHAGKDMDELFDQTDAAAILLSREVRLILDSSRR